MALTRDQLRALASGGAGPDRVPVHLPVLGEDAFVVRLGRTQRQELSVWAAGELGLLDTDTGDLPEDLSVEDRARMASLISVGGLRYGLVDGNGDPLIDSFELAAAVFENLDELDWQAISDAFGRLRPDVPIEDVEAGKGSSSSTRRSSGSTT